MHKLLTPKELSETLQVGKTTVYQWVHYGFVPYIKIGSAIRFRENDVEEWLRKRSDKGRDRIKIML